MVNVGFWLIAIQWLKKKTKTEKRYIAKLYAKDIHAPSNKTKSNSGQEKPKKTSRNSKHSAICGV